MKQSLSLKQSQQLSLTPQLKQSLLYLQLASNELENEIQQALDENPLLEQIEKLSPFEGDNEISDECKDTEPKQTEAPSRNDEWSGSIKQGNSDTQQTISQTVANPTSLFEHALWQVRMTNLSERDQLIATTLLHCLDSQAYLQSSLEQVCALFEPELEIECDEVHAVLSLIKTLDPIGLGAENLSERLLILLKQCPQDSLGMTQAKDIIAHHLDLLAKHDLNGLKQKLNTDNTTLQNAIKLITALNPNITSQFTSHIHNQIIPDVVTNKVDNQWVVELNPNNHHKLSVNHQYDTLQNDKKHGDYIKQHLNQAVATVKSLQNRYDTLLQVSNTIVQLQQDFFDRGEEFMRPLILQDIAQQLGLHESTISRATSGKYIASPRGVHELKFFFSSAINNGAGENVSSTVVRSLIKNLIDNESKQKPLSDNKIAKLLELQGHKIARRTIAKYRESMNIPSSSLRKPLLT